MVRTEKELSAIGAAAALGDLCFTHILNFIQIGMTEKTIADEIDRFLLTNGGEKLAFPTICVSGARTALPHGEPTDKVTEKGEFLTLDFGAVVDGCCGDMTRTIALGSVSPEQKKVYDIVLKAQIVGCEAAKAGLECYVLDMMARDIINLEGYGDYFVHGLGHGVGAEVHQDPRINANSSHVLAENMAITIEPGIYIPDKFGVRIEDLAIVKSFGIINLVHSTKELIIL